MRVAAVHTSLESIDADVVVHGVFADPAAVAPITGDANMDRQIIELFEAGELTSRGSTVVFPFPSSHRARYLTVLSLGQRENWNALAAFRTAGGCAKSIAARERATVAISFPRSDDPNVDKAAVRGAITGCQGQDLYRAEKRLHPFQTLLWHGIDEALLDAAAIEAECTLLARRWVNRHRADGRSGCRNRGLGRRATKKRELQLSVGSRTRIQSRTASDGHDVSWRRSRAIGVGRQGRHLR